METELRAKEEQREVARQRKKSSSTQGSSTVLRLLRRDGPECCWCGVETSRTPDAGPRMSSVEHLIPKSAGGAR